LIGYFGVIIISGMEESRGTAEVIKVTKHPILEIAEGVEVGGYTIEAKMSAPAKRYSTAIFSVKITKPDDLSDRVPSVMDYGKFTFDSPRELKFGELLEISISPA
jgi:hypothetical protein